jgi:dihydroorotase
LDNNTAISYAVVAYRKAVNQNLNENEFEALMYALMDEYTEAEISRMAKEERK